MTVINNLKEVYSIDIDELKSIYYLYEFTDDLIFLTEDTSNYPNIFNFVKTGILTEEEAYEGLLHQKGY